MGTIEHAPSSPSSTSRSQDSVARTSDASSSSAERSRSNEIASQESLGKFGRYDLKQVLGSGAFGVVYRAWDSQLSRQVAIKVPRFDITAERKRRRFEQEARAAAKLQHPNIVVVLEEGIHEGKPFIVSEFVDGEPLSVEIRRTPPAARQVATWVRDLANALAYAHKQGVVHRDIKPDNIMLGKHGRPQIMDFGLAKQVDEDSSLSIDGSIMGTPSYMAPEQARGETASVDGRSDQYSLGAVLYEMLAGTKPFSGSPHVVLAKVADPHTEPPSPRKLQPTIAPDLEAICLKSMSKSPADRYANMSDMAADLDRWLAGKPTKVRPVGRRELAVRWCRRNPTLALASSLSAAAVLLLAVISVVILTRDPQATVAAGSASSTADVPPQPAPTGSLPLSPRGAPGNPLVQPTAQPVAYSLPPPVVKGWQGWPTDAPEPVIAPVDFAKAKRLQQAWADYLGVPVERTISLPQGESLSLMFIPPGEFMMGSSAEERRKTLEEADADPTTYEQFRDAYAEQLKYEHDSLLTINPNPFYIAKTELTQAQWAVISQPAEQASSLDFSTFSRTLPATNISAVEADDAMNMLSQTLTSPDEWFVVPAEKEWEYACRAGTASRWYFGEDSSVAYLYAWSLNNAKNVLQDVGELLPNAWGLHDMHGNALEWCANVHGNPSNQFDRVDIVPGLTLIRRGGSVWSTIRRNRAAGITTGDSTDKTSNAAKQTTVRVMLTIPREERPADYEVHAPIEDYLRGRMELTVAQDGSGMFDTIQAALDVQKDGEIVRVLDRGPYRESLKWKDKIDCGLISMGGTVVIDNEWQLYEEGKAAAQQFTGLTNARVHGFTFVAEDADPNHVAALRVSSCPGFCMESCIVWSIPPDDASWKTTVEFHEPQLLASQPFCIRECQFVVSATVRLAASVESAANNQVAPILPCMLTRNWFYYPTVNGDDFDQGIEVSLKQQSQQPLEVTFLNNIINRCGNRAGELFNDSGLVNAIFSQNTITSRVGPALRCRNYASTKSTVRSNLCLVEANACQFDEDEGEVFMAFAAQGWDIRDNFSNAPADAKPGVLSLGDPSESQLRLLSTDPKDRDFMRLVSDATLRKSGNAFPGAVLPGSPTEDGDWLTKAQQRWRDALLILPAGARDRWLEPVGLPEKP